MPGVCLGCTWEFKELSRTFSGWSFILFSAGAFILFMQMSNQDPERLCHLFMPHSMQSGELVFSLGSYVWTIFYLLLSKISKSNLVSPPKRAQDPLYSPLHPPEVLTLFTTSIISYFILFASESLEYNSSPGFPGGSGSKASACNSGDLGSIPGLGRSPGEGNGNPLQYSCLENPKDGGAR